jgi:peptidoglycan/xylan/chitin deacetylase (PgdA/CDA1 family)
MDATRAPRSPALSRGSSLPGRVRVLKKLVKSSAGFVMFHSFLHRLLLSDSWVVVAFHRVNDHVEDGEGLTCGIDMFEQYCRFFARFFRVLPLRALVEKAEHNRPTRGALAITFDDGYRDNYEHAAPLLKSFNLPATFFVTTKFIGTDFVPWWDRDLDIRMPWMTWDQVRLLHREGFEIGSHTQTHPELTALSPEAAIAEILGSCRDLEQQLSSKVFSFAFPYGQAHQIAEEHVKLVRSAGLRCCCSCYGGINGRGGDPLRLRRVPISPWYLSPYHFGLDLCLCNERSALPTNARVAHLVSGETPPLGHDR